MAFRIRYHELLIEIDTAEELREAVRVLGLGASTANDAPAKAAGESVEDEHGDATAINIVKQRWQQLCERLATREQQLKALHVIRKASPPGVRRAELVRVLGVDSPNACAGVIAGIAKNAKRAGLEMVAVVSVSGDTYNAGKLLLNNPLPPLKE